MVSSIRLSDILSLTNLSWGAIMVIIERPRINAKLVLDLSANIVLIWAITDRQVMITSVSASKSAWFHYRISRTIMCPRIGWINLGRNIPEVLNQHSLVKMLRIIGIVSV